MSRVPVGVVMRIGCRVLAAAGAASVVTAVVVLYATISAANRAEHCLHAMHEVTLLLDQYVDGNGTWPASWEELEKTKLQNIGFYRWPEDADEVRRYVAVDFHTSVGDLVKGDVGVEQVIRPVGLCYEGNGMYFDQLRRTLSLAATSRPDLAP